MIKNLAKTIALLSVVLTITACRITSGAPELSLNGELSEPTGKQTPAEMERICLEIKCLKIEHGKEPPRSETEYTIWFDVTKGETVTISKPKNSNRVEFLMSKDKGVAFGEKTLTLFKRLDSVGISSVVNLKTTWRCTTKGRWLPEEKCDNQTKSVVNERKIVEFLEELNRSDTAQK